MSDVTINKSVRNSNLELLKIIAMILICFSHTYKNLAFNGVCAADPSINPINWLIVMIKNMGWIGDYIFIIASVYFLNKYKDLNIKKIAFYYIEAALMLLSMLAICVIFKASLEQELVIATLTTVKVLDFWYIGAYLLFLLVLPSIHIFINKMTRTQQLIFNIFGIVLFTVFNILYAFDLMNSSCRPLAFLFMFSIMDYGIKYGKFLFFKENDQKRNCLYILLFVVIWFALNAGFSTLNYFYPHIKDGTTAICYFYNPIFMLITIPMFLVFKDMNPQYNKVINYVSSLSLVFYIMHENPYIDLLIDPWMINAINAHPEIDLRLPYILLFSLVRLVIGIAISIVFKETIGRLLKMLFNLDFKSKKNLEPVEVNSVETKANIDKMSQ